MRITKSIVDVCVVNVRQHPQYACAASLLDTTSHYLQPSPIVEIRQLPEAPPRLLASSNLLMSVALVDGISNVELDRYFDADGNQQPYLSGSVVSSTYKVHAEGGAEVRVFLFPEIKVWVAGDFKLRFSMFEQSAEGMRLCHVALSARFTVYQSNIYPGTFPPTPLDVTLASQNVRQRIFRQPFIRRPKLPSPTQTTPEKGNEELPRPPQLFKIPAKGQSARRRYATSTPASRLTGRDAAENKDKLVSAGQHGSSSERKLSATPLIGSHSIAPMLANSKLASVLATVNCADAETPRMQVDAEPSKANSKTWNEKGNGREDEMTCTVTNRPTRSPSESRNTKPRSPSGKMSLRNLLS